ncbi:MAG: alpha-2-macroglobulin family protein, partial [Candidatus Binatia bacterium]
PAALVQEGIRRVRMTQQGGGGFSLWPESSALHPWTSVYATHFLSEAKRAGYDVDDVVLAKALDFVAGDAKAKESYGQDELERAVYALYVLARVGKADLGTMDFIRAKHRKDLRPDSRALLAAAYAQSGNRQAVEELIKEIDDADRVKRSTGYNFSSTIRSRALLLLAFLDVAPKDPRVAKLVQRLGRDADAGEWTTQESAFTLLALGQFHREQAAKGPFKGTVLVGDRQIGHFSNEKPATFGGIEGADPIRVVLDEKSNPEAVFYSLETRGIPTDAAYQPESAGLEIGREYLTRAGGPLDLASVAQGDIVVTRLRIRSTSGRLDNVVIENLLPSGLEVENPRLQSSETLPWVGDADLPTAYVDFRDDRVLVFADLGDNAWRTAYVLLRAVTPGRFRLPPVQAEAMYDPSIRARGERAEMKVRRR